MGNNTDIICRQISKEKRIRLIKTDFQNIFSRNNCYAVDETGNITGLNLSRQVLKNVSFLKNCPTLQWLDLSNNYISDLSMLTHLKNLLKLDISQNRITDISCLRELKKLNWLNLKNNKITTLPGDILEWGMEIKWESENSTDIILVGNPLEEPLIHAIEAGRKTLKEYLDDLKPPVDEGPSKRILILSANPIDTKRLRLEVEVRDSVESMLRSRYRDKFDIRSIGGVRLRDMRTALLDNEPHIVHFTGHGKEDGLVLEGELGFSTRMSAEALGGLFKMFSNHVECVILNACNSEKQAAVICEHIAYVVGMRGDIRDKAAIEFAVGFYDGIGAGRSIEEAFEFGRNAVHAKFPDEAQHLIPVLKKKKKIKQKKEV
jgi:hypothetical protein